MGLCMALAVATLKFHCARGFCTFAAAALCDKESLAINSGLNLEQRKCTIGTLDHGLNSQVFFGLNDEDRAPSSGQSMKSFQSFLFR